MQRLLLFSFKSTWWKSGESDRLTPVCDALQTLLGKSVQKLNECVGPTVENAIKNLQNSDILMLENIRFYKEEEANDDQFSKTLAGYADFFVQDAFGTVHRQHSSTVGIAKYLPSFSGKLLDKEIDYLNQVMHSPCRPLLAIVGGAKISSKFAVLEKLLDVVDVMVLGGAMVYTLMMAQGQSVGQSLVEPGLVDKAIVFLDQVREKNKLLYLPEDHVVVSNIDDPASAEVVDALSPAHIGVDVGPTSIAHIESLISTSNTVFWNGPLGVFETPEYSKGTFSIARVL